MNWFAPLHPFHEMLAPMKNSAFAALLVVLSLGILGCAADSDASSESAAAPSTPDLSEAVADTATFAGGCFWCMEPPYDKLDGVTATISGFSGGTQVDPSYREVAMGRTDHTEVVQVIYDSTQVDYETLLRVYWHNVDPLDGSGQFCDRGSQYRPAIFPHNERQRRLAEASKETVAQQFSQPIQVEIVPFEAFYRAEAYHQNYYRKNPTDYQQYRTGCRRDARLQTLWGDKAGGADPL
jgi:peptide-methionine (S)-S-oxide reductase